MALDLNYSSRIVGLHLNGTNGSTSFLDNSPSPKTITAVGGAQISTTQQKFGGASAIFNGTNAALNLGNLGLHNSDITISGWVRLSALNKNQIIATSYNFSTTQSGVFIFYVGSTNKLTIINGVAGAVGATNLAANTWYHVEMAYVFSTKAYYIFLNGTLEATFNSTALPLVNGTTVYLAGSPGDNNIGTWWLDGYLDDFYIWKPVALHTSGFSSPTEEYIDASTYSFNVSAETSSPIGDFLFSLPIALSMQAEAPSPLGVFEVELPLSFSIDTLTSAPTGIFSFTAQQGAAIYAATNAPVGLVNVLIAQNILKKEIIGRNWRAVLTGSPDLIIPISSVNGRLRSAGDSTLTIVCPDGINYAAGILARISNGFKLVSTEVYSDGTSETSESQIFSNLSVPTDRGARNFSVTITGKAALTFSSTPRRIAVGGIQYEALQANGARRVRASLDKDIQPKDIAVLPSGSEIIVDAITYLIATRQMSMELTEAA
jgi:hypothetical protein